MISLFNRLAVRVMSAAFGALCFSSAMAFPVSYNVVDVATLSEGANAVVRRVNNRGVGIGGGRIGSARRGLVFSSAGITAIDGSLGSDYTTAFGINDFGVIVGGANGRSAVRAFIRASDESIQELAPLPGDTSSTAFAVNNSGHAVGMSSGSGGERAVIWTAKGIAMVLPIISGGDSGARAINSAGDVVGASRIEGKSQAVLWLGGGLGMPLGALSGYVASEALAINARRAIVGYSSDGAGARRATLWRAGGPPVDLGALPGGTSSQALDLNEAGLIVGTSSSSSGERASIWMPNGEIRDLNALIPPGPVVLTHATGINRTGAILAFGHEPTNHLEPHDAEAGHDDTHELPFRVFLLFPSGTAQP